MSLVHSWFKYIPSNRNTTRSITSNKTVFVNAQNTDYFGVNLVSEVIQPSGIQNTIFGDSDVTIYINQSQSFNNAIFGNSYVSCPAAVIDVSLNINSIFGSSYVDTNLREFNNNLLQYSESYSTLGVIHKESYTEFKHPYINVSPATITATVSGGTLESISLYAALQHVYSFPIDEALPVADVYYFPIELGNPVQAQYNILTTYELGYFPFYRNQYNIDTKYCIGFTRTQYNINSKYFIGYSQCQYNTSQLWKIGTTVADYSHTFTITNAKLGISFFEEFQDLINAEREAHLRRKLFLQTDSAVDIAGTHSINMALTNTFAHELGNLVSTEWGTFTGKANIAYLKLGCTSMGENLEVLSVNPAYKAYTGSSSYDSYFSALVLYTNWKNSYTHYMNMIADYNGLNNTVNTINLGIGSSHDINTPSNLTLYFTLELCGYAVTLDMSTYYTKFSLSYQKPLANIATFIQSYDYLVSPRVQDFIETDYGIKLADTLTTFIGVSVADINEVILYNKITDSFDSLYGNYAYINDIIQSIYDIKSTYIVNESLTTLYSIKVANAIDVTYSDFSKVIDSFTVQYSNSTLIADSLSSLYDDQSIIIDSLTAVYGNWIKVSDELTAIYGDQSRVGYSLTSNYGNTTFVSDTFIGYNGFTVKLNSLLNSEYSLNWSVNESNTVIYGDAIYVNDCISIQATLDLVPIQSKFIGNYYLN